MKKRKLHLQKKKVSAVFWKQPYAMILFILANQDASCVRLLIYVRRALSASLYFILAAPAFTEDSGETLTTAQHWPHIISQLAGLRRCGGGFLLFAHRLRTLLIYLLFV